MEAKGRRCRDHIPPDLNTGILIWLPVKSLMRFSCVSKSWQSLIKDSTFITNHRRTTPSNRKRSLLVKRPHLSNWETCISIHYDNEDFKPQYMNLEFPRVSPETCISQKRVFACNELVCVFYSRLHIILWNPSIRKYITLPKPNIGEYCYTVGFGFDPKTNDYKLVRNILYLNRVEIFSLNTGSWREIGDVIPHVQVKGQQICVNGVIYWTGAEYTADYGVFIRCILAFALGDEKFKKISLCEELGDRFRRLQLAVLGESIFLIQYYRNGIGFTEKQLCSIWVMEEPSVFVKVWTFSSGECLGTALGFKANGEILIARESKRLVYSYDPRTFRWNYLKSIAIGGYSLQLHTYVESLVLL